MFKKVLFASVLSCTAMTNTYAGFYIGPTLAYQSITVNDDRPTYQGLAPRFSLGYEQLLKNDFKVAMGVFYGPKSFTINSHNSDTGGSLKTSYSYGASIMPGYIFDDVVSGYLRVGAIATHFSDADTTRNGMILGAGVDLSMTENWDMTFEYDYSKYNSISGIGQPQEGQFILGFMRRL